MFMDSARSRLIAVLLLVDLSHAADVDYITNLPVYDSLRPCASDAIANVIETQIGNGWCDGDVTALQSCVCATSFDAVSNSIQQYVGSDCGSALTEYQSSANAVLKEYCDQGATILTSSTYSQNAITSYIEEIDVFSQLAPCAQRGLTSVMNNMTQYNCPAERNGLASCVCNEFSASVKSAVKTLVSSRCSYNSADVTSAWAVFSGYCSLSSATPSMPTFTDPPGDMTYYITDISDFQNLQTCVQNVIGRAVMGQSLSLCPGDSQALASCVCIKEEVSNNVFSKLTRNIRFGCSTMSTEGLSSATDVLDLYCSAARGEISLSVETGIVFGPEPTENPTENNEGTNEEFEGKGVIVGAILGSFAGLAALVGVIMLLSKRRARIRGAGQNKPIHLNPLLAVSDQANNQASTSNNNRRSAESDTEAAPPPYEPGILGEAYMRNGGVNATTRE